MSTTASEVPKAPAPPPAPAAVAAGVLRTARPRQWLKNVLVVAAPVAAGVLTDPAVAVATFVAFVCFCLAASGTYLINDALDAGADRAHPKKRFRPVAAGVVPVRLAAGVGAVSLCASIVLAFAASGAALAAVVAVYVAVTAAYSTLLKRVAVIELAAVASGFVLRAIAGGVASGVALSDWFLIVASFGALGIVADKRFAELRELEGTSGTHRVVLGEYSTAFLNHVRTLAAAVAVTAYCLWAFESASVSSAGLAHRLSIVPFVLALLHYALRTEQGYGSAPEDLLLADRTLQILGVAFCALFAVGVYYP